MLKWVRKGIKTGVKTTRYPAVAETAPGVSPGRPAAACVGAAHLALCPTGAIQQDGDATVVEHGRCVHCFRCRRGSEPALEWEPGYEWGGEAGEPAQAGGRLGRAFARSIHIRVVDAGACGACLSEIKQLSKPYYDLHRLGFFVTPTPRHADVLLVAGPVTDNMRLPLEKAYDAMPAPKIVVAVGACAISGGVFGRNFVCEGGAGDVIPVSVTVPGCPPPPLAILHGLLVATGRKPSSPASSRASLEGTATS